MSDRIPRRDPLVAYLQGLAEREDRATFAALRSSLSEGHELKGLRIVLPFLGSDAGPRREDDAMLLAGLFALHPESGPLSLAAALRRVWSETGSDSVEQRFLALLDAARDDLAAHLRHAVSLIASKKLGVDWDDLYRAIKYWDHPDDFVRRDWARSFWGGKTEEAETASSAPSST